MACEDADVFTLGFSNRTWEDTVGILDAFRIERLVDVRTLPGSKKYPQFNIENLSVELPKIGVEYLHKRDLGGFRKGPSQNDLNAGWRNESFRNYADYMQSPQFVAAVEELITLSREKRTVYVCTEAVFWRCHRALISDALLVRGIKPGHIFTHNKCEMHKMTKFAVVERESVTYPAQNA